LIHIFSSLKKSNFVCFTVWITISYLAFDTCGCLYALNELDKVNYYKGLVGQYRGLALATDSDHYGDTQTGNGLCGARCCYRHYQQLLKRFSRIPHDCEECYSVASWTRIGMSHVGC
jgi:hypothetical protein